MIFLLLVSDVFPDGNLIPADRGDEVSPGPEMLPDEVAFPFPVHACPMNGALALDGPDPP